MNCTLCYIAFYHPFRKYVPTNYIAYLGDGLNGEVIVELRYEVCSAQVPPLNTDKRFRGIDPGGLC